MMKAKLLIVLGGATALIAFATWIPGVLGADAVSEIPPDSSATQVNFPLDRRCTVTVDPTALPRPVNAGPANLTTGFTAPDVAEGTLVRMDSDWIVLREGRVENWIAAKKVIIIHFSD